MVALFSRTRSLAVTIKVRKFQLSSIVWRRHDKSRKPIRGRVTGLNPNVSPPSYRASSAPPADPAPGDPQGRKKTAKAASEELDWEPQRFRALRQLYTALQLQLRRLWDPPVPDEEFVK